MKEEFAKIIELDNYQVLVTKKADPNAESDTPFIVRAETIVNGKRIGANTGFTTEEHMNNTFDSFGELEATNIAAYFEKEMKNVKEEKPQSSLIMPKPQEIIT
jgi:hypothetical protein